MYLWSVLVDQTRTGPRVNSIRRFPKSNASPISYWYLLLVLEFVFKTLTGLESLFESLVLLCKRSACMKSGSKLWYYYYDTVLVLPSVVDPETTCRVYRYLTERVARFIPEDKDRSFKLNAPIYQ